MAKIVEPVLPFDLIFDDVRAGGLTRTLHRQLRTAIIERRLPPGYRLPSSRALAVALGIGRNTVITAYDQLVAGGYVRSRQGARLEVSMPEESSPAIAPAAAADRAGDARLAAAWRRPVDRMVYPAGLPARCFRTGVPENRLFDHHVWRRLMMRALRNAARLPFNYGPAQGLPELQDAIAGHVAFVRAVVCKPADVIVTAGAQQAFDIIARLLVVPGETRVAVENPGFPPLRAAFAGAGSQLVPVVLDDEGLRVDLIPADVRVICVTPSHQSPTGVVMSSRRRAALLTRARDIGAIIVEDDYDGEFLYDPHPQDALQTLDRDGRVFYVGTFSKSLFPSLRLGFVVAPDWAREAMIDIKRASGSHTDGASQATLASFIAEGHLARHIRRMRPLYAARRRALEEGAAAHWRDFLHALPGNAGLHLSLAIPDAHMAGPILELAARFLPGALPLSSYALEDVPPGLCIGYGGVEVDQIAGAVRDMGNAMRASVQLAAGRERRTRDSNL